MPTWRRKERKKEGKGKERSFNKFSTKKKKKEKKTWKQPETEAHVVPYIIHFPKRYSSADYPNLLPETDIACPPRVHTLLEYPHQPPRVEFPDCYENTRRMWWAGPTTAQICVGLRGRNRVVNDESEKPAQAIRGHLIGASDMGCGWSHVRRNESLSWAPRPTCVLSWFSGRGGRNL